MAIDEDSLLCLLGAPSKEIIDDILMTCFRFRQDTVPQSKILQWREDLGSAQEQIVALIPAVTGLINECLLHGTTPKALLSEPNAQLAGLLGKLIKSHTADWTQILMENQVSAARLINFDVRVDTTVVTNQVNSMNSSSVLLHLQVQNTPVHTNEMPSTSSFQLELSQQELQTLLDGMLKIRDQLDTIQ